MLTGICRCRLARDACTSETSPAAGGVGGSDAHSELQPSPQQASDLLPAALMYGENYELLQRQADQAQFFLSFSLADQRVPSIKLRRGYVLTHSACLRLLCVCTGG